MNKAILEIDEPEDCMRCQLYLDEGDARRARRGLYTATCHGLNEYIPCYVGRYERCPLKIVDRD